MSKRPKTANSFMSRLRRPVGRLGDLPIWSKLGLIMVVPTIATVVVGTNGLVNHLDTLGNAGRASSLADLSAASGNLVHDLQNERAAAVMVLSADDAATKKRYLDAYNKLNAVVDTAKVPYSERRTQLPEVPATFGGLLIRIDQGLQELPGLRSQVVNSANQKTDDGKLKLSEAARTYEILLSDLLDMRDSAAQLAGDTAISEHMRSAAALAQAKEFLSRERVVVLRAFDQGSMTPALFNDYIGTRAGQSQARQSFEAAALRPDSEFYNRTVAGPALREADSYGGAIRGNSERTMSGLPFDAAGWDAAMLGNANLIRTVEQKIDRDVVAEADALRSDVQQQVFVETGLLLSMLLLAILFAYLIARSMARSLRELRHGALSVAQYGLPQAVARLRDPQVTSQLSPVQVANQIAEPLPVRTKDEFGQVTEAFNAVHLEAVRTAAEQAQLRSSVSTMFVNLARRSQILVDRLIGHLDRLERGEEDPDRLAELFQLDHLATRMRRNDENLLVLAGADSTRVQREPAALIDVLRAAQSEVEHYTRIEFGVIDRDIEVAAHAVNDLVHLVAELFDNATAFSPPDSHVMVEARRVGERAVLYVEDRGIGITADQLHDLNERLATPPQVDVTVSRMMGLVVVARLGTRHGVKVELRPAAERGTIADVTLPAAVLVPRALAGRNQPAFMATVPDSPAALEEAPPAVTPTALPSAPVVAPRPVGSQPPATSPLGRPFDPAPLNGGGLQQPPVSPRSMPAWSDLTGAANGAGNFTPRPTNGQRTEPLPHRRGDDQWAGDGDGTGPGPTIPRQLPTTPETQSLPPVSGVPVASAPPVSGVPVASAPPVSGVPVASAPPVSVPPVSVPPVSVPPVSVPPVSAAPLPPVSAPPLRPVSTPPAASAPPVWPPVSASDREGATPPVPEKLAAALDMTAELPRVTRSSEPAPTAAQPVVPAPQQRVPFADETMELPIFRELESAWFRTRKPTAEESRSAASPAAKSAVAAATEQLGTIDPARSAGATKPAAGASAPARDGAGSEGSPAEAATITAEPTPTPVPVRRDAPPRAGWQTAADDGWRAATAAAQTEVEEKTQAGLPKRVPMAQLVPGGVEKATTSVQRRTPESVRGLLSAYHRGVKRGRTQPKDDNSTMPEATPDGQQSSQAGKEHEG
ncbi:Signal transduction histidine kinase [Micromonospora pattaloongensis]|uniref:histidine kinase n=1 Tax=Micromonospora pattaloongensis TaxID=405436 RepID=A0A1H3GHS1_9ACTN|nr:sensor histidine kinase [Micromonospora pattaloongensis]SDY02178.1 Signal transduction histidine kinase [Micromonospora pattaloongensis]